MRLWNAATGELQADLGRHGEGPGVFPIKHVVFSPDGRMLASDCRVDGTLKVWDVAGRRQFVSKEVGETVCTFVFAPSGRTLAVGFVKGIVKLFDPESGQECGMLHGEVDEGVLCLAFSPDGATLATAGDRSRYQALGRSDIAQRQILVGHGDWVESLAFARTARPWPAAAATGPFDSGAPFRAMSS